MMASHSQIVTETTSQNSILLDNTIFSDIGVIEIRDLTALPSENTARTNTLGLTATDIKAIREHLESITFRQILHIILDVECKQNVLDVVELLQQVEGIRYVGPNIYYEITTVNPNDPDFRNGNQWALNGTNGINAPGAWGITTGSRAVRVGIIDSGIARHPDLDANIDFTSGGDFYNIAPNNIPGPLRPDTDGHGTESASVVGAVGNNGIGVTGVAQQVTLVPLQTGYGGSHPREARADAVRHARDLWNTNQRISILTTWIPDIIHNYVMV
jgi:hypothetical protein